MITNQLSEMTAEIHSELRGVLRLLHELRQPIGRFISLAIGPGRTQRHFVDFQEGTVPTDGERLKIRVKRLSLPDERIQGRFYALAQGIWHLKDRLKRWCRGTKAEVDVEAFSRRSSELLICADLANFKKHGRGRSRSGLDPRLTTIEFDTSKNGVIELHYDGATKEKELWVEHAVPIAFRAPIIGADDKVVVDDALPILLRAVDHWRLLIKRLGILDRDDPESAVLARLLFAAGAGSARP